MSSFTFLVGIGFAALILIARKYPRLFHFGKESGSIENEWVVALLSLGAYLLAWSRDMPKFFAFLAGNPWSLVPLAFLAWWAIGQGAKKMFKRVCFAFLITSLVKLGTSLYSACDTSSHSGCPSEFLAASLTQQGSRHDVDNIPNSDKEWVSIIHRDASDSVHISIGDSIFLQRLDSVAFSVVVNGKRFDVPLNMTKPIVLPKSGWIKVELDKFSPADSVRITYHTWHGKWRT